MARREIWHRIMPHRVSFLYNEWIIHSIGEVCKSDHARQRAIPGSLVTALEDAWTAVLHACPSPLDVDMVGEIRVFTDMNIISAALLSLKAIVNPAVSTFIVCVALL